MRNRIQFYSLLLMGLIYHSAALISAEFTVSSASFQPNDSSISISVMLSNPSSASINLAAFSFELTVTPISPRRVEFDPLSQPNSLGDSNYIFFGNSSSLNTPLTPWSVKSTGGGVNNTIVFSDSTDTTSNVSLAANSSKLLANLNLVPGTGLNRPQAGDVYQLSFLSNGTSIFDENLNPISFTTGSGSLTVPVPEPSSYMMVTLAFCVLLLKLRFKARKLSNLQATSMQPIGLPGITTQ